MRLAVVIVNYNVKYFLEQCLESVYGSERLTANGEVLDLEVWVVDNASVDGSVEMVRERFPDIHLIANTQNAGFAKANNQALRQMPPNASFPDAVLLLNPDTVVERDTLVKCMDFMATHPDCGGLGVKMINGEGQYLKESKRGFPSPEASFFKISGLIRLFPHHRRIAAYYMGHLPIDEVNEIDILPGAFLMVRREALQSVGLLDESYFMYGEDIDFSWRIRLAGYRNYYLPSARIIHYKGESTKRGSMNYVYTFYNAMSIFVQHYFSGKNARLFNLLLHLAIWARATLSFLQRALKAIWLPIADFTVAYAGFLCIEHLWSAQKLSTLTPDTNLQFSIFNSQFSYYPPEYIYLIIPLYILFLMAASWLYGGYVKPVRLPRIVKGMAIGSALLLVFYSLLDESMRYSRALLLMGCGWTLASTLGLRALLSLLRVPGFDLRPRRPRHCLVVGSPEECDRIKSLYAQSGYNHQFATLAESERIADAIRVHKADEVVFCGKDIPVQRIIDQMTAIGQSGSIKRQVEFKIAPDSSSFVIGSTRIHSAEDLYTEELNTLASPLNRRNKRLFDIVTALLLLLVSPILVWFQKEHGHYFRHCLQVLVGRKSWVGEEDRAIFTPEQALRHSGTNTLTPANIARIRLRYSRNYRLTTDLLIVAKNLLRI